MDTGTRGGDKGKQDSRPPWGNVKPSPTASDHLHHQVHLQRVEDSVIETNLQRVASHQWWLQRHERSTKHANHYLPAPRRALWPGETTIENGHRRLGSM